jgi:hypothetical protein
MLDCGREALLLVHPDAVDVAALQRPKIVLFGEQEFGFPEWMIEPGSFEGMDIHSQPQIFFSNAKHHKPPPSPAACLPDGDLKSLNDLEVDHRERFAR